MCADDAARCDFGQDRSRKLDYDVCFARSTSEVVRFFKSLFHQRLLRSPLADSATDPCFPELEIRYSARSPGGNEKG